MARAASAATNQVRDTLSRKVNSTYVDCLERSTMSTLVLVVRIIKSARSHSRHLSPVTRQIPPPSDKRIVVVNWFLYAVSYERTNHEQHKQSGNDRT
jgi:hypothetical protein